MDICLKMSLHKVLTSKWMEAAKYHTFITDRSDNFVAFKPKSEPELV